MTESAKNSHEACAVRHNVPVVLFGRDTGGKPHASRFEAADAPRAVQAAGLMGMRVLRLVSDEERALAEGLSAGRIFSQTGRGFVPFVAAPKFAALEAAPNAFSPERPVEADLPPASPQKAKGGRLAANGGDTADIGEDAANGPEQPVGGPTPVAIGVGMMVLAAEDGVLATWYPAKIIAERGEGLLQLRWAGEWADEPPFLRRLDHVALVPPALAGKLK